MARLPKDTQTLLPANATGPQVRSAILAAHSPLEPIFETGIGYHLMFLESEILVAALLQLISEGVTALPMHDGIMCQRSKADAVEKVMGDAAEKIVSFRLPISRKTHEKL
jgi:hypothetical protein